MFNIFSIVLTNALKCSIKIGAPFVNRHANIL